MTQPEKMRGIARRDRDGHEEGTAVLGRLHKLSDFAENSRKISVPLEITASLEEEPAVFSAAKD